MVLQVPRGKAKPLDGLKPGDLTPVKLRPGETLARLAKANKVPRERLRRINGVTDESEAVPGTTLLIPRAAPARAQTQGAQLSRTVRGRRSGGRWRRPAGRAQRAGGRDGAEGQLRGLDRPVAPQHHQVAIDGRHLPAVGGQHI